MEQFGAAAPPASSGPQAGFVLLFANEYAALPAAWPFPAKRLVVGREHPADLVIPVHAISRVHAEVVWDRAVWRLRDLGSTNGTLIDGCRVQEAPLEPHEEVRFGDAILKFVERDAPEYAHYRIDGAMLGGHTRLGPKVESLIGGYQMDRIAGAIERVAQSALSVLLLGESGTGKEVVARELHRVSGRRGEFRAVNCAAIPQNLLESELFGYKRGAFSGADRDKMGLIRAAHNGTLLLDEIGDMPLQAQAKLLRVLQSKELYPVGSTSPENVDVRIVSATHRDLKRLQEEGRFRRDLFARLNEYQLRLPPLRERKEDIYRLLQAFLARHGRPDLRASFRFMTGLLHYDWPYNVRELEACAKRCVALSSGSVLDVELLPEPIQEEIATYGRNAEGGGGTSSAASIATPSAEELKALLTAHAGNIAAVGRELGKARMQIHRWIQRYGIDLAEFRG